MASTDRAGEAALEKSYSDPPPLDVGIATDLLTEVKQIMDQLGVVFFLRQGTCLGAIRDNGFIPWDDDIDIGSIIGLHNVTDKTIDTCAAAFRDNGYYVSITESDHFIGMSMMKSSTRIDWTCYRIVDDSIFHYPGVFIPARLFTQPREIDFAGGKFLVPNPPEEYLCCKYGAEWMIPKKVGFEKDVLALVSNAPTPSSGGQLWSFLSRYVLRTGAGKLRVLDYESRPVAGAEVRIAGIGRSKTNRLGYAKVHLPRDDWYAVVIKHGEHEELLYQEQMRRSGTYIYRPDPSISAGRLCVLSTK